MDGGTLSCAHEREEPTFFKVGSSQWAYLGSNQGPLPCEGSALPLSYMPSAQVEMITNRCILR